MKQILVLILIFVVIIDINAQTIAHKYEAVEGVTMGIWPHENRLRSAEKLKELRDKFGFNFLLVAAPYGETWYQNVKNSGFDSTNIVKQIYFPDFITRPEWFWNNIYSLGTVYAYYFDEPLSRGFPFIELMKLKILFSNKGLYPKSYFFLGEVNEYRAKKLERLVDVISYTGYGSKDKNGLDQRKSWQEWKEVLGDKFSMLWIGAHEDSSHFSNLFKAAKELGYKSIWLYQYEPLDADKEIGDEIITRYCEAAVEYGFMKYKKD